MTSETAPPLDLSGLWVPIVTPFDDADRVDLDRLGRLATRLLAEGAGGLVALGTTGEPATLGPAERLAVVEECHAACRAAGRPLLVGVGGNDTASSVLGAEAVAASGVADGLLVVVPYYTRPSTAGVIGHLAAMAAATPLPVVAYNVPYRTGRGLDAAAVAELASISGVVGIKQAVGSLDLDTLEVLRRAPPGFAVLAGDDAFIGPTILAGGAGAIAAAAHLCTDRFAALVAAALAGDGPRTARLAARLLPLVTAGFAEPSPAVWKGALHATGELATDRLRRPLTEASAGAVDALLEAVAAVGSDRSDQVRPS